MGLRILNQDGSSCLFEVKSVIGAGKMILLSSSNHRLPLFVRSSSLFRTPHILPTSRRDLARAAETGGSLDHYIAPTQQGPPNTSVCCFGETSRRFNVTIPSGVLKLGVCFERRVFGRLFGMSLHVFLWVRIFAAARA